MKVHPSTNKTSMISLSRALVIVFNHLRSNNEPSSLYFSYTLWKELCSVWFSMHVKNKLKRTGARTQPCFTQLVILKGVEVSPLERIIPIMTLQKSQMILMDIQGHQCFARMTHSASLLTVSKALVKSMKTA